MEKILITGASGHLGLNLALYAQRQGYEVLGWANRQKLSKVPFTVDQFDLTDTQHLREKLESAAPDMVIHTAALANLEGCDKNPELAYQLNAEVPGLLAWHLKRMGVPLLHISTDAVFDGTKGDYSEIDMPNPINTYAHSKLMGEDNVSSEHKEAIIARVVFFGWTLSGKRSLAEFFYNRLRVEETANGFTDMVFTPLYVEHLASLLLEALEKELHGTYHFFGNQAVSKYAFGVSLAREFGFDESLVSPISVMDSELTTQRSLNLSMKTDKLCNALGHELPGILEGLKALHLAEEMGLREHILGFGSN
ncbi:MAG TPA: SDR family oxidoreductase [Anaerolineaceae bacterium]|nr:SDR family oxidoreductase [Anaerolineaceae bacterium]